MLVVGVASTGMYFLWSLTVALLTYLIYKLIETISFLNKVSKVPGPKSLPIIGNIHHLMLSPEKIFVKMNEFGKQFYPIYRLQGGIFVSVIMMMPEDIEIVLSGMKHIEKSELYICLHAWLGTGLLTSTDEKWQNRRKILTPAFHFNILQHYTQIFKDNSVQLLEEIDKVVGRPVDVVPIVTRYTLRTICEAAMGTNLEDECETYLKAVQRIGQLTIFRILRPWFHKTWTYVFSPKFYENLCISRFLHSFSRKIISERKKKFTPIPRNEENVYLPKKKLAMLDLLLSAKAKGAKIDDEGIREEVDTFMFEGHDTTAMCISFTLMLLACHREIQLNVVAELNNILENTDRAITHEDLQNMKYLERVLKESLRLYPSVPFMGRYLSEQITTHSGYILPKDTMAMIRVYDVHHNPNLYPDPERFDPDRFLLENMKNRHPYAYIPFSAGPRNCIGQRFALLELKAIIAAVLKKFELAPVDTPDKIPLAADILLRPSNGIRIMFQRRS